MVAKTYDEEVVTSHLGLKTQSTTKSGKAGQISQKPSLIEHPSIITQKRNSRTNVIAGIQQENPKTITTDIGAVKSTYNPYETIKDTPTHILQL